MKVCVQDNTCNVYGHPAPVYPKWLVKGALLVQLSKLNWWTILEMQMRRQVGEFDRDSIPFISGSALRNHSW